MSKITISGFYDEISGRLSDQIRVLHELGEQYTCPRNLNGKNIADYTFEEFERRHVHKKDDSDDDSHPSGGGNVFDEFDI